uniref:Uncharacterized protein n=1 Tax=Rhizophora mucronata TaxID=61149 RepID=A0A2P2NQ43_RHIMU
MNNSNASIIYRSSRMLKMLTPCKLHTIFFNTWTS